MKNTLESATFQDEAWTNFLQSNLVHLSLIHEIHGLVFATFDPILSWPRNKLNIEWLVVNLKTCIRRLLNVYNTVFE